jgi:hypothetical protein
MMPLLLLLRRPLLQRLLPLLLKLPLRLLPRPLLLRLSRSKRLSLLTQNKRFPIKS